ncbi:MAG: zinc-ribbon domain-containing protein [Candidatus Odinarchaeota archaeon]
MSLDYMNHMIDWSPNGWLFLVLGGLIFLLFIIILLYGLSRRTKGESYKVQESNKMETQESYKAGSIKINGESFDGEVSYCPTCGEKLDERTVKFCPLCGSKI